MTTIYASPGGYTDRVPESGDDRRWTVYGPDDLAAGDDPPAPTTPALMTWDGERLELTEEARAAWYGEGGPRPLLTDGMSETEIENTAAAMAALLGDPLR